MRTGLKYGRQFYVLPLFLLFIGIIPFSTQACGQEREKQAIEGSIHAASDANLSALATITKKMARKRLLNIFQDASIDELNLISEDGFVVYSAVLELNESDLEVVIDAGNGSILRVAPEEAGEDSGYREEEDSDENVTESYENEHGEENDEHAEANEKVELPVAVEIAFHKSYPSAEIIGTDSEIENGVTLYEVESTDGDFRRDLLYNSNGTAVEIEESIEPENLPDAVRKSAKLQGAIQKAERITKGSSISYELLVGVGRKTTELVLDPGGTVLSSTAADGNH